MGEEITVPVSELLAQPELRLRLLAGHRALHNGISWAHASELPDPTEFLRGGELLLLLGVNLAGEEADQRAYLSRLVEAGVSAVGFGTGLGWDAVPPALVETALRAGLPLFEVPRAVPFIAISRAVAAAINRRERAAAERLLRAQRTLTAAAVGRHGLAAVLDEVVRLVSAGQPGWGLLLNRAGGVLATAPGPEAAAHRSALAADLARLRAAPGSASLVARDGEAEVWVQSLHGGSADGSADGSVADSADGTELLGFLAIGRSVPLTSAERQIVNASVPLCTLLLNRANLVSRSGWRLRAAVLRLFVAGVALDVVAEVAGQLWNGLPAEPVALLVGHGGRGALAAARGRLETDRQVASAQVMAAELDGELVVVCAAGAAEETVLRAVRGIEGLRVGVSEPAAFGELGLAREQARRAAGYGTGSGTVITRFGSLPSPGLLALLPAETAADFSAAVLRPLMTEAGEADRGELLRTLKAWLAHHGQWEPAAAELGVHRHTLRNRIRKVERLLGRELDSPDLRAELWLALRLSERSEP
ncbi:MAG TPA: PucR family transcriptional regulator [Pseudonocardia sp.]